ncbi:hypothetical protein KP509_30G069100 [Ceratopteris richardii]|uniref:Acyl-[acyl-carrier-protein] desaturase n=1 Tax=Ceratopteris richardii TaxID=49495 RepID=A0A8T2R3F7_CERRI|nr:hypothetical protein KP509_30G069100 [Ceratopteris richardii]
MAMLSSDSLVSASHVTNGTKMMLPGSSARYRLLASPPNNVIMLEQRCSLMSCRDSNIARAMVTTTICSPTDMTYERQEMADGSSPAKTKEFANIIVGGKSGPEVKRRQEIIELFESLQGWAQENLLPYLKPVDKCWQPQDFLPDPTGEGFEEELRELRRRSRELPPEYLVCLVGDMITEEALPTYQCFLNSMEGVRDETGNSDAPWARWIRGWTAEENRHGDLLHNYLYLSGRVDMRSVQKTIHYLIAERKIDDNPYLGFIYASFQERATFISHGNTAAQAKYYGDMNLAKICGTIASDERRHEKAYHKLVEKLFEMDPNATMVCLEDMMRKRITMPARLMYDGCDDNLYEKFSLVAQRTGVYTSKDYADILEHLIKRWNVDKLAGLSSRAQQAQDYVCNLAGRIRRVEERIQGQQQKGPGMAVAFSWIFNKQLNLDDRLPR